MNWALVISSASPLVAAIGLYLTIRSQNANQFRIREVADWSDRCIEVLQSLAIEVASATTVDGARDDRAILELGTRASILVEQGRMYFRNESDSDGANLWKPEAYRGTRPEILDQLVIAFAVTREWQKSDVSLRAKLVTLAIRAEQRFVTLVQMEVGRSKVSSTTAGKAGNTVVLDELIDSLTDLEMRNARSRYSDTSL